MKKVSYMGLSNCLVVTNGAVELVLTTEVGPRVLRYGFVGGENLLGECAGESVATGWGEWRPRGGHRLWVAPESMPGSYEPDEDPLEVEPRGERSVRLVQPTGRHTGLQKEIAVTLDDEGSGVTLTHRITNRNAQVVELAAWALTIMRGGGEAVIPQEPYGPHPECLLPARALVLWPYTDMTDARLRFGKRFVRVRTDGSLKEPQKLGVMNKQGWAAYLLGGTLFVKRFGFEEGASYPDFGCNTEVFTAASFIEVESLSPLRRVGPGESVEHVERWQLFEGVDAGDDEESLSAAVGPLVGAA